MGNSLKEKIKQGMRAMGEQEEELKRAKERLSELARYKEELAEYAKEAEVHAEQVAHLKEELTAAKDKLAEVVKSDAVKQTMIDKGKEMLASAQAQSTKAQTDLMAKARQNAELKLDLSKLRSELESEESKTVGSVTEVTTLEKKVSWAQEVLSRKDAKLQEVSKQLEQAESEKRASEEELVRKGRELF